jgi:hypothetical protein
MKPSSAVPPLNLFTTANRNLRTKYRRNGVVSHETEISYVGSEVSGLLSRRRYRGVGYLTPCDSCFIGGDFQPTAKRLHLVRLFGRGDWIRTSDPLRPRIARTANEQLARRDTKRDGVSQSRASQGFAGHRQCLWGDVLALFVVAAVLAVSDASKYDGKGRLSQGLPT